jgi:hypothetical protein
MPSSIRDWLRLPSRVALLLGLGAFSVAGAKADTGTGINPGRDDARVPQHSAKPFGDLLIWQEEGRIYVSEAGKPAEELRLGDTAEAAALKELLGQKGATAATPHALRDRIILVGAGGSGLHWDAQKPDAQTKPPTTARDTGKVATGTAKPTNQTGNTQASSTADNNKK